MFLKIRVKKPEKSSHISYKETGKKGTIYVYYTYGHSYDKDKGYTVAENTSIGKVCEDDPTMMYPNPKYYTYFPDEDMPEEDPDRSSCIKIGSHAAMDQVVEETGLKKKLDGSVGSDHSGIILDFAAYQIVTESNVAQYYPDYAYDHALFTDDMQVYSDSTISSLFSSIDKSQIIAFLNSWNADRNHNDKLYVSYDSTNMDCESGNVDIAEPGHNKSHSGKPIFNYSMAYDKNNRDPLFYEDYPGSIVDISQLKYMVDKAHDYGYRNIGFILDRGYFDESNLHYITDNHYSYIIMMKGKKALAHTMIDKVKGTFEEDRSKYIDEYQMYGTTVKEKLFPSDKRKNFFHIYYSHARANAELLKLNTKIKGLEIWLDDQKGKPADVVLDKPEVLHYFNLILSPEEETKTKQEDSQTPETQKDGSAASGNGINAQQKDSKKAPEKDKKSVRKFLTYEEKVDVINEEARYCGYFIIITSGNMSAKEALKIYKSRDASEKLFRSDKSYLGEETLRAHSEPSVESKMFVGFIATIIRNRMFAKLEKQRLKSTKRQNYMSVPAAIKELDKIEMIRIMDQPYRLDHAVTATQKEILKAFGMTEAEVKKQAERISSTLEEAKKKKEAHNETDKS